MKRLCFLVAVILLLSSLSAIVVPFSDVPVITDANMLGSFERITPEDGKGENLMTKAWLWQDGNDLVVYFEAEIDDTFQTSAAKMRDRSGDSSDYLRVQLVTQPDSYFAYYFLCFPDGGLYDGTRGKNMSVDYSWDCGYSYTSNYTDTLWKLTVRIPLAELRFAKEPPYDWKIILGRYHYKKNEMFSSPYAVSSMGNDYFTTGTDIRLEHRVSRQLDIKFKPYLVRSYDLMAKSSSFDPDNLGLDISFNPSQHTRIKVSLNPDYSDAPPDYASDDYNQKDPPYYAENRYFFSEDIEAFVVNDDIFYSRNIAKPSLAFKATGSGNTTTWGVLGALDQKITDDRDVINNDDYFQLLSLRNDRAKLTWGSSLVSRINHGYYNQVALASIRSEFAKDWWAGGELAGSYHNQKESDPMWGYGADAYLSYQPQPFNTSLYFIHRSADYNPEAGYFYSPDQQSVTLNLMLEPPEKDRYLRTYTAALFGTYTRHKLSEEVHPIEYNTGFSTMLAFRPRLNVSLMGIHSQQLDLFDDAHHTTQITLITAATLTNGIFVQGAVTGGSSLVYALSGVHDLLTFTGVVGGRIGRKTAYQLNVLHRHNGHEKLTLTQDMGDVHTILDNSYQVINLRVSHSPSSKSLISTGCAMDTYERMDTKGWVRLFANVRYEFMPDSFIYLGASSRQTKYDDYRLDALFDDFVKNSATAYMKVALTL